VASTAPLPEWGEVAGSAREQIRSFIAETFFVDSFADRDSFLQTGIIDSNGMMLLVVFIEQQFSIEVDDVELLPENLDSLDNISSFIGRKQRENKKG
jgi:acyl carrier protein